MPEKQWTTTPEVVAYIVAHLIGIALVYVSSALFMGQIYVTIGKTYGYIFVTLVALAQSLVAMVLVLLLFLALRMAMMGGPPRPRD
jgi:hypothetical protein